MVHPEPADPLYSGHHPYRRAAGLQDRPLLDMQLQIGPQRLAERCRAGPAQPVEFVADTDPRAVGDVSDLVQRQHARPHGRAHHRHREARALLVGPHRHFDRGAGLDAVVVERLDHLQPAQHAVDAVEAPAGRLSVEMAAQHHRRGVRIGARPSGEEVAHAVELEGAARPLGPADEQLPPRPVVIGQSLTVRSTGRRSPPPLPCPSTATKAARDRFAGLSWQSWPEFSHGVDQRGTRGVGDLVELLRSRDERRRELDDGLGPPGRSPARQPPLVQSAR